MTPPIETAENNEGFADSQKRSAFNAPSAPIIPVPIPAAPMPRRPVSRLSTPASSFQPPHFASAMTPFVSPISPAYIPSSPYVFYPPFHPMAFTPNYFPSTLQQSSIACGVASAGVPDAMLDVSLSVSTPHKTGVHLFDKAFSIQKPQIKQEHSQRAFSAAVALSSSSASCTVPNPASATPALPMMASACPSASSSSSASSSHASSSPRFALKPTPSSSAQLQHTPVYRAIVSPTLSASPAQHNSANQLPIPALTHPHSHAFSPSPSFQSPAIPAISLPPPASLKHTSTHGSTQAHLHPHQATTIVNPASFPDTQVHLSQRTSSRASHTPQSNTPIAHAAKALPHQAQAQQQACAQVASVPVSATHKPGSLAALAPGPAPAPRLLPQSAAIAARTPGANKSSQLRLASAGPLPAPGSGSRYMYTREKKYRMKLSAVQSELYQAIGADKESCTLESALDNAVNVLKAFKLEEDRLQGKICDVDQQIADCAEEKKCIEEGKPVSEEVEKRKKEREARALVVKQHMAQRQPDPSISISLMMQAPVFIGVTDMADHILEVNLQHELLSGIPLAESRGTRATSYLTPPTAQDTNNRVEIARERGITMFPVRGDIITRRGDVVSVVGFASILTREGVPFGIMSVVVLEKMRRLHSYDSTPASTASASSPPSLPTSSTQQSSPLSQQNSDYVSGTSTPFEHMADGWSEELANALSENLPESLTSCRRR